MRKRLKFGLETHIIKKIQDVFASFPQVQEVILYGSRAKGNYRPGSDIDLTLRGNNLNLSVLNAISMNLDDLDLPYLFDLSIYAHIRNPELIDHIKRTGIIFYKKEIVAE